MTTEELAYSFNGNPTDRYAIEEIVKGRIGNMCYVSGVPEHEDDFIHIGVYTDEIISDSIKTAPQVRFLKHDNVFRAYCKKADYGQVIVFPSLSEIDRQISTFFDRSRQRSESNLLQSAGSKIIQIPSIRNQMNPIFEMITTLLRSKSGIEMAAFKWSTEKLDRYVGFLKALDVISIENSRIVQGSAMQSMDRSMDTVDIYDSLLARMVENSANYMVTQLNMTHLQPYLKLSNANCMTSYIEDTPLKWNWKKYAFYLKRIYGVKADQVKIEANATMLSHVKIFSEEPYSNDTVYSCTDEIFGKYKTTAKKVFV